MKMTRLLLPLLLLALGALPAAAQVGSRPVRGADRIRMITGDVITGTIVRETPTMVEIRMAKGMIVGIEKSRTLEIVRTSHVNKETNSQERPRLLAERNLHFLVLGGDGRVIGTRQMLVKEEPDKAGNPTWRLEETWSFLRPGHPRLLLVRCEHLTPLLRPISCFYRESCGEVGKVVRGRVEGEKIAINIVTPRGRRQATLPFVRGMRFPLMHRELLRQKEMTSRKQISTTVYDPMQDVFRRIVVETGRRRSGVKGPFGEWGTVFILEEQRDGRTHQEWLDSQGRTLYLEANGLELTAVRCSREKAERLLAQGSGGLGTPPLVRGNEAFLRLPDPGWKFSTGHLPQALSADLGASLQTLIIKGDEGRKPLAEIARGLARRIDLGEGGIKDLEIGEKRHGLERRLVLTGRVGEHGSERIKAIVYRRPQGGAVALVLRSPRRAFRVALSCLDKVVDRVLPPTAPARPQ